MVEIGRIRIQIAIGPQDTHVLIETDIVKVDRITPRTLVENVLGPDVESTRFIMTPILRETMVKRAGVTHITSD
jgi:hypothetical protein